MKHKFTFFGSRLRLLLVIVVGFSLHLFAQQDTVRFRTNALEASSINRSEQHFTLDSISPTDSLVRVVTYEYRTFVDTVLSVISVPDSTGQTVYDTIPVDSTDRRGHYIQAYIGLGYGSLGYKLQGDSHLNGSFSGLLQLQYAYFFHQHWGVGAGLWFTNYTSFAHLEGDRHWTDQTDSDNEQQYDHTAHIGKWRERETIHNLGIPISLQFQTWNKSGEAGFFAAVGVAPSFSVMRKYRVLDGELTHSGYYPNWNLTLQDMYEFQTYDYTDRDEAKGKLSVRPAIGLFVDLGALIYMTPQIDLMVGGYANFTVNDVNKSDKQELGWKDEHFDFMNAYQGVYATTEAGKSHPWEVGLKLGIHWHHIGKPKVNDRVVYDYFIRQDSVQQTLARIDTITTERIDTLLKRRIQKVQNAIDSLNLVWFAFDSDKINAESAEYLDHIYDVLKDNDHHILIGGHASKEGQYQHNVRLARRRAQSVANYLIKKGIDRQRLQVESYGPDVPYRNNPYHDLSLDRRVEMVVIK